MAGKSTRFKPGDTFAIATPKGAGYFQFVGKDPTLGALIRILPGTFPEPPADLAALAASRELYYVNFPLGAAVRRNLVRWVGHFELPEGVVSNPPRRQSLKFLPLSRDRWRLFDGVDYQVVDSLTEEQGNWSPDGVWNDTLLAERMAEGWLPRDDD